MLDVVVFLVSLGVRAIRAMCRHRADLVLENVALRQQVTALKKERPRPPLEDTERAFWLPFEVRGPCGRAACSSSTRTPWPVGIATDSDGCAPQKVDPALTARFRFAMVGCFWPIFFFADHNGSTMSTSKPTFPGHCHK